MSELNRRSGGSDDPTPPRNDKSATDQPGKQNAPDAQPDAGTTPGRPLRPGDHKRAETFNSVDEARAALPRNINSWSPGNPRHVQAMRYLQSAEDARSGAGPQNREQRCDTQPTPPRPESPSAELAGLHARAATDRGDLARHDRQPAGQADARPNQDGPTGSDDPERGSDDDRTDDNAPPGDRPENDDPEKPADASGGDGRDGDGPNNPPPPDGPDDGRDSPDELAAAKARIAELEKQLDAAKAENEAKDATIGRLQDTCTYLDRGREAAETKAAEQSARVDALTGTVGELTSKIDAQQEAADSRAAAQDAKIDKLTSMVESLIAEPGDTSDQPRPDQAAPVELAGGPDSADVRKSETPDVHDDPEKRRVDQQLLGEGEKESKKEDPVRERGLPKDVSFSLATATVGTIVTALGHFVPTLDFATTLGKDVAELGFASASALWTVRLRRNKKNEN